MGSKSKILNFMHEHVSWYIGISMNGINALQKELSLTTNLCALRTSANCEQ